MPYNDLDWKAINTIRVLAVRTSDLKAAKTVVPDHRTGRCHIQSQLRTPRCSYGLRSDCARSVQQIHDIQSTEPKLDQSRSFRPIVCGTRLLNPPLQDNRSVYNAREKPN